MSVLYCVSGRFDPAADSVARTPSLVCFKLPIARLLENAGEIEAVIPIKRVFYTCPFVDKIVNWIDWPSLISEFAWLFRFTCFTVVVNDVDCRRFVWHAMEVLERMVSVSTLLHVVVKMLTKFMHFLWAKWKLSAGSYGTCFAFVLFRRRGVVLIGLLFVNELLHNLDVMFVCEWILFWLETIRLLGKFFHDFD